MTVQRLKIAMSEYDNDRWRIISGKVGNGFSATACKEKALEIEMDDDDTAVLQRRESYTAASLLSESTTITAREPLPEGS
ncbi:hypothetical protein HII31_08197 [Pseudocercospora fuligena]|uniref:Uncharacterized protein n=1 Tax=Pseudocercospora fuligena TaxID=685502 RepID=A0A8H6VFK9_9PEZI|nr:hypothetical protein HII31_08197 [Pseudocercospora fuligena]